MTSPLLVRAAAVAQVAVDDLSSPELSDDDAKHLAKALRLRPDEIVVATDGLGSWRLCRWASGAELIADSEIEFDERVSPQLTVGFCALKGDRTELVVQKLTELGVDNIVLLEAERSVVRWSGDKAPRALARLRRIAYDASMQSRRVYLPTIERVESVARAVESGASMAVVDGEPPSLSHPFVIVGPEGGWSPAEVEQATHRTTLGDGIFRAETAAISAGSVLNALRSQVVDAKRSVTRPEDGVRVSTSKRLV